MIRKLEKLDIKGLNTLPPIHWNFDYEAFLQNLTKDDFFHAFVMTNNDQIIGTGNVLLKEKVGWLSNIIVDKDHRGKGLGHQMTTFLVDFLNEQGCETQLLIATKPGEAVYNKIGFRKTTEYLCFDSKIDLDFSSSNSIRILADSDIANVYQLDREANGEDRPHLIDKYYRNGLGVFSDNNQLLGFYLPGFASGLVLSRDPQAGIELLRLKHSKKGKRTRLPIENHDAINSLESLGLKKGENFSRMVLGKELNWNPKYIYSYGGGYCG